MGFGLILIRSYTAIRGKEKAIERWDSKHKAHTIKGVTLTYEESKESGSGQSCSLTRVVLKIHVREHIYIHYTTLDLLIMCYGCFF